MHLIPKATTNCPVHLETIEMKCRAQSHNIGLMN
jgi:hypothetical protein